MGYLLENVNISDDTKDNVVMDSQTIRYVLGAEVVTDAARHNSCAHRLRTFWTNKVNPGQFQKAVELTHMTTTKVWHDCLEPCHRPNVAMRQETKPFYRCNVTWTLVRVAPTYVSYGGSHAFKDTGPGMVQHTETREWRETMPVERERAIGFPRDTPKW